MGTLDGVERAGAAPSLTTVVPAFDTVRLEDVSRHYGRRRALSHVWLEAVTGEVLGVFGPNGAGKSTLLSILSTLLRPGSGRVQYGTKSADELGDTLRRHIGMLGHDMFLYGDLTARENLRFFGRLYAVDHLEDRTTEALRHARLTDRADDRAGGFSRGLRQRLAFERAILHDPRLVLLDEPFTGLDDQSAGLLVERLGTLRSTGCIIVMATHDFDTAESVVDRSVCVDRGRLWPIPTGTGTLRERYRRTLAERG